MTPKKFCLSLIFVFCFGMAVASIDAPSFASYEPCKECTGDFTRITTQGGECQYSETETGVWEGTIEVRKCHFTWQSIRHYFTCETHIVRCNCVKANGWKDSKTVSEDACQHRIVNPSEQ